MGFCGRQHGSRRLAPPEVPRKLLQKPRRRLVYQQAQSWEEEGGFELFILPGSQPGGKIFKKSNLTLKFRKNPVTGRGLRGRYS